MRIRVVKTPTIDEVDGIRLDQFRPVGEYRLGNGLAALFLAEGWGEPVDEDAPEAEFEPSEGAPVSHPPNLFRERFPPYYDVPRSLAADRRRTRRYR
jgi:hypothetical protein